MTRFRAYVSDSSSSEDEEDVKQLQPTRLRVHSESEDSEVEEAEEDNEAEEAEARSERGMSSSEMLEDELIPRKPRRRPRTALVEDENGDIQLEADDDEDAWSSSASSSRSASPGPRGIIGDPGIIPRARGLGIDPQKIHVMQASLFGTGAEAATFSEPKARHKALVLQPALNRKHSRDSDGDGLRHDSRERASFADEIEQGLFRPSRKYARVAVTSSIAQGKEGEYVDAGLALGRSFRVGWGPGGTLVHLGAICGPHSTPTSANTSVLSITRTPFPPAKTPSSETSPPAVAAKLLQHHLSNTPITKDDNGVPYANVKPDADRLNFAAFASLFPTTDAVDPAPLFRLGSALFDPIDLRLNSTNIGISTLPGAIIITPDVRNKISRLRRRSALSNWLETVVSPAVEGDVRTRTNGEPGSAYSHADTIYTQLTGHQIPQACTTAMDAGYLKLATLVSQAGGDDVFKADIQAQIEIWRSENIAPTKAPSAGGPTNSLMNRGVWKVYQLLGGLPSSHENSDAQASWVEDVCSGLDWKRILGLCLWYGSGIDASVTEVVHLYESLLKRYNPAQIARPLPKWTLERKASQPTSSSAPTRFGLVVPRLLATSLPAPQKGQHEDPLYSLIRMHADPALSLSQILDPLSFGPDERWGGIGMCWHLYMILSRVMRVRDFPDRQTPRKAINGGTNGRNASTDDDAEDLEIEEGHSPTADLLASSYAFELESWGMVQEAAFVLLHLEQAQGREKALKDLLGRSAPKMDDWMTRGLVGSLKIPMTWVNEAKAAHCLDRGEIFNAYELYISAQLYSSAHDLAVLELAPDAILRRDLDLLRELFEPFDLEGRRDKVEGWFIRGKVFIDYVNIMTRVPALYDQMEAERKDRGGDSIVPDAAQADELDDLIRRVPKVIALLPDVLHRGRHVDDRHAAAIEEMTQALLAAVGKVRPSTLLEQPVLRFMDGTTKINLIRGKGYARFLQNVSS